MKRFLSLVGLIAALTISVPALATTWTIDADHSSVGFKIKHLMVTNVNGNFTVFSGSVMADDADIARSKVEVSIDAASIDTNVVKRDEHLRSADFFDVARHPKITFVSKNIARVGPDKLAVKGDLTIHGVTREVVLDVTGPTSESKDPWGNIRRGASATTTINRKDFGLTWNKALETGGVLVGEEVHIAIEVEMIKGK